MSDLDKKIFGEKKLSDLFKEIYYHHKTKSEQINLLINELKPLVENIGDATLVVPLIKYYLDISVKNDDTLVKMTQIAQKSIGSSDGEGSFGLSDEEKQQLINEAKNLLESED